MKFTIKSIMSDTGLDETAARGLVTLLLALNVITPAGVVMAEGVKKGRGANVYELTSVADALTSVAKAMYKIKGIKT